VWLKTNGGKYAFPRKGEFQPFFFFLMVLGFEPLRQPFFGWVFFEIGYLELFAPAVFEHQPNWL
jgi:hypothetical protein